MSLDSSQQQAAADQQRQSAALQQAMAGVFGPQMTKAFSMIGADLGSGYGEPASVKSAFGDVRDNLNQQYAQQGMINKQYTGYEARRSGQPISQGQIQSTIGQNAYTLEQDRQSSLRNLKFQEAQASMGQYQSLLGQLGQGIQTSTGIATGNLGMAGQAIAGMNQKSQFGGAMGGAVSGATTGMAFGPYGALAGGVLGGALGYMQGG
jgi:hypothetical protein